MPSQKDVNKSLLGNKNVTEYLNWAKNTKNVCINMYHV